MNKKFVENIPKVIRIEPSASCNLKCIHCPTGTIGSIKGIMSDKTFQVTTEKILPYIKDIKVIVLYHGGEPLLNKKFIKMVEEFALIREKHKADFLIKTVSNGLLIDKKMADELSMSGLDYIEISIDGTSEVQNETIRRGSNTQNVISNMKILLESINEKSSNLRMDISTTQFINSIEDVEQNINSEKYSWIKNNFNDYIEQNKISIKPTYAIRWSDMIVEEGVFEVIANENGTINNYCDHINNTITIRYNGDIVPCCYDLTSKLVMGNIEDEGDLYELWNNEKYLTLRESINSKEFVSICKDCSVVNPEKYLRLK